jgi:hypothetical protein
VSLEKTSRQLLSAIEAEDFDALDQALQARAALLASGAPPTPEVLELGDRACTELAAWKRRLAEEAARLTQLRSYL